MSNSNKQPRPALQLVFSSDAVGATQRQESQRFITPVRNDQAWRCLLQTMQIVSAARRHASLRNARKVLISQLTLSALIAASLASIVWISLNETSIGAGSDRRLTLISAACALLALVVSCRGFSAQAAIAADRLERCAFEIDAVRAELAGNGGADAGVIHSLRQRYHLVERECRSNHIYCDYLAAKIDSGNASGDDRWRAALYFAIDVYGPSVLMAAVPLALLFV